MILGQTIIPIYLPMPSTGDMSADGDCTHLL